MPKDRIRNGFTSIATRLWLFTHCSCRSFSSYSSPFSPLKHRNGTVQRVTSIPWTRGAKRKATLQVKELPQGELPIEPVEGDIDSPTYPTVIQQARNNMRKFAHCLLLTRVGSFYELYFEHAEKYGPLLNLKVAQKETKLGPVPMAGFPLFQLDRYLKILVQDHQKYVAISEEIMNDMSQKVKSGELMYDRQVRRVVTPGTLIDENFLSPYEHNYLLAVHVDQDFNTFKAPVVDDALTLMAKSDAKLENRSVGLAWLDLSSGDFLTETIEPGDLASSIMRIRPKEVLADRNLQWLPEEHVVSRALADEGHTITYTDSPQTVLPVSEWTPMLEDAIPAIAAEKFTTEEKKAVSLLLQYAGTQLPGLKLRLQAPIRRASEQYMGIDKNSLKGLEIIQTLRDGLHKGSLLHAIRRTCTESGARLLQDRLTSPSTSIAVINDRLGLVEDMLRETQLREEVVALLSRTSDTLRLIQKFSFGRGNADDLLSLSKTIDIMSDTAAVLVNFQERQLVDVNSKGKVYDISNGIAGSFGRHINHHATNSELEKSGLLTSLQRLLNRFHLDGPAKVSASIRNAIDEDGLSKRQRINDIEAAEIAGAARSVIDEAGPSEDLARLSKRLSAKRFTKISGDDDLSADEDEVWIMQQHASPSLQQSHEHLKELREEKSNLTEALRKQLGAPTLTLRWTPSLRYICHVKGKDTKISFTSLENARAVSSSKSTRSIQILEWTVLGERIDEAKLRIRVEERRVFQSLRDSILQNLVHLRRNAAILDELDVACSFATLAKEQQYVRPVLNHSTTHKIVAGRHPTVEASLISSGRPFTTNDCFLSSSERLWLITGPNMAGKSTFLRQNALISILAQTGGFVPAEFAEIGLVDQVFSRVGSADNVSQHQSTFMVEMLETAHILRNATARSFVIMDEIGRGTTPEDGIAVGYAALYHLHNTNRCRALFATHFHALADMTRDFDSVRCYCTSVVEDTTGSFAYIHRLQPGVNRDSHALKVARLAGMPESAINVANEIIGRLKPKYNNGIQETLPSVNRLPEAKMEKVSIFQG